MPTTLIEPAELARHLGDPDWAVVDCRFDLARPEWGAQAFVASHIPHALYAHLDGNLSAPRTVRSGRHPLPQIEVLAATFGRWGIDERVAVLNGGLAAWERAGLPLSTESVRRAPRRFTARPDPRLLVAGNEVAAAVLSGALTHGQQLLVDARSADRFAGENETIDPVAGHIPGARNHPFAANLDAQGRFLEAGQLRRSWENTLRGALPQQLIAMCGSGVTACHNLLALEVAGLGGARLYAGSWSEWITDPAHPIARGPADPPGDQRQTAG